MMFRGLEQSCKCEKEAYQTLGRAATVFVTYLTAWYVQLPLSVLPHAMLPCAMTAR